jgi:hypothetical protein
MPIRWASGQTRTFGAWMAPQQLRRSIKVSDQSANVAGKGKTSNEHPQPRNQPRNHRPMPRHPRSDGDSAMNDNLFFLALAFLYLCGILGGLAINGILDKVFAP